MQAKARSRAPKEAPADPFGWAGSTLDTHFAVQAVAGQGGFGIVYRGLHLGLDVPVAIKCLKLPAELGEDERKGFLSRLRNEARLLHRLSRQTVSIVQALHVGAATAPTGVWTPYLVMEWLDGETLDHDFQARRRSARSPRGLDEAMRLLGPVVAALSVAHEENVAHLDLKPANLIFTRVRTGTLLKVLDFGVARTFVETPSLTLSLTEPSAGSQPFTPQYGAPEQFSLQYGVPGPWTDVFAMTLLLIEAASGRRALEGENIGQLYVAAIDEQNRSRMISRISGVSPAVDVVLRRALDVNPRLRFRNLGEMWSALLEARGEISAVREILSAVDSIDTHGFGEAEAEQSERLPGDGPFRDAPTVQEHAGEGTPGAPTEKDPNSPLNAPTVREIGIGAPSPSLPVPAVHTQGENIVSRWLAVLAIGVAWIVASGAFLLRAPSPPLLARTASSWPKPAAFPPVAAPEPPGQPPVQSLLTATAKPEPRAKHRSNPMSRNAPSTMIKVLEKPPPEASADDLKPSRTPF